MLKGREDMKTKRCRKCGALYPVDMQQCPTCGKVNNAVFSKTVDIKPHCQSEPQPKKATITCPYCKSTNTKKITSAEKVVNIALFGIFGNKRKHQWHCNDCKSDF